MLKKLCFLGTSFFFSSSGESTGTLTSGEPSWLGEYGNGDTFDLPLGRAPLPPPLPLAPALAPLPEFTGFSGVDCGLGLEDAY